MRTSYKWFNTRRIWLGLLEVSFVKFGMDFDMGKWNIFNMTLICLPSNSKGVTEVLSILNYKAVLGPAIIERG